MKPAELRTWRETYLINRPQLADLLDVNVRTVARWETGETPVPGWLPLALETLGGQRATLAKKLRDRGVTLKLRRAGQTANLRRGRAV